VEIHGTAATHTSPERRSEQAYAHRQDRDHRVMHFIDADPGGDGKQRRAEQNDRRNAFEQADISPHLIQINRSRTAPD